MSDEETDFEEPVDEPQTEGEDTAALEQEARSMGWVPKEEFRGPETQWRDANEFVERGRTMIPILNARLREKDEKLASVSDKVAKLEQKRPGISLEREGKIG